jgi:signal transduction histidine kinase
MAVIVALDQRDGAFAHPNVAMALTGAALGVTAAATVLARTAPTLLVHPAAILVELALGITLVLLDPWLYDLAADHTQSFGSVWPLAAVLSAGIAGGGWAGVAAGASIGLADGIGEALFLPGTDALQAPWAGGITGAVGSVVLYGLGGLVAGLAVARLREAEREIALARARDEVGRTLHDGVLQTLAIVQRRSDDGELVALARDQELDLRRFLFGTEPERRSRRGTDPESVLRGVAADAERRHGIVVQVVGTGDAPAIDSDVAAALTGAVGECLANAARHGDARRATVFVDREGDGVLCSVKDDGRGFDPSHTVEGVGLERSVRGRVDEVHGTVAIESSPGRGAEITLVVPRRLRKQRPDGDQPEEPDDHDS